MIISVLKKYVWVINLILLAGISYTLAQVVNDKIKGGVSAPQTGTVVSSNSGNHTDRGLKRPSPRGSYDVILQRNIFGLQSTSQGTSIAEAPQTTLNLELLATSIRGDKESIAVIKNIDTAMVRGYSEGDLIDIIRPERVKLARIENCRALVERREGAEIIKCRKDLDEATSFNANDPRAKLSRGSGLPNKLLPRANSTQTEAGGVKEVSEGVYEIDQKMLDEVLSDTTPLLTQARVIPQEDGLRFFAIRPNSIFFLIGLRNGDILHKINDVELSNVENALGLLEELRRETRFSINLTRRGQKLTYEYTVR